MKEWHEKSGLDIKRFFNTSGILYKEMQLKDKLPGMTTEEKYELLATDGMLTSVSFSLIMNNKWNASGTCLWMVILKYVVLTDNFSGTFLDGRIGGKHGQTEFDLTY